MTTSLIITTFNRPSYLSQCLTHIKALSELPDLFIIVDDASEDETKQLLYDFRLDCRQHHLYKSENQGIKDSLIRGFNYAFQNTDIAINLDSDAIVRPDFITRLKSLKMRFPDHIVSGFNCNHPKNPVLFQGDDYVHRLHCNGINMCMDKGQYDRYVKPALSGKGNWDFQSTHDKPFVIAKPSVVQHIGMVSSMGHNVNPDVSCDYHLNK